MIYIAKLLSFVRSLSNDAKITDVKIDMGGGDNKTAQHFSAPGDDSFPLKTDYVLASDIARNGGKVVHGYLDPINNPEALEGDKRIYGRDPINGVAVNQVWLKSDGSILISNANGSALIMPNGDFSVNGVTITVNGDIIAPNSLLLSGKEIAGHDHPIAWTDPAGSGTSGPNN